MCKPEAVCAVQSGRRAHTTARHQGTSDESTRKLRRLGASERDWLRRPRRHRPPRHAPTRSNLLRANIWAGQRPRLGPPIILFAPPREPFLGPHSTANLGRAGLPGRAGCLGMSAPLNRRENKAWHVRRCGLVSCHWPPGPTGDAMCAPSLQNSPTVPEPAYKMAVHTVPSFRAPYRTAHAAARRNLPVDPLMPCYFCR